MLVRWSMTVKDGAVQEELGFDWRVVGQKRSMPKIILTCALLVQLSYNFHKYWFKVFFFSIVLFLSNWCWVVQAMSV